MIAADLLKHNIEIHQRLHTMIQNTSQGLAIAEVDLLKHWDISLNLHDKLADTKKI